MEKSTRVLNFGSLNMDYVYQVSRIVGPGETIHAAGRHVYYGGKGLNQSVAAARAGASVSHAGKVGRDGDGLIAVCERYGINTEHIERGRGDTGHTFIQVDQNGQNSIVLFGGSNREIEREQVDRVLGQSAAGELLLLQNEINGLEYMIRQGAARGLKILLNPSPCDQTVLDCPLEQASWLVFNEVEGWQLTGRREPAAILEALKARLPHTGLVLTLGVQGAFCQRGEERLFQPSFSVAPVDTTGAGDTFLGYFAAGLAQELSLSAVLEQAAAAAALAITRRGAVPSIPSKGEVEDFLAVNRRPL